MDGKSNLYLHGQSNTSSVKPRNNIKHIESNADVQSNNLAGLDVANHTRLNIKHIKNIDPGTIPNASGLCNMHMNMNK